MKDLKKLLKEQSKQILPDENVKENIRRELGYSEAEQSAAYAHGGTGSASGRKKWIAIIAAGLALVLCLCIILPVLLQKAPAGPGFIDGGKLDSIDTADEFYAYSAASVGSILASAQTAAADAAAVQKSAPGADTEARGAGMRSLSAMPRSNGLTDEEQEIAATVNGYLGLVEGLLSDEAIEYNAVELGQEEFGYPYRMTVTVQDMLGGAVQYTMYYNKILTGSETDGDEREEEYAIEGILLVDGNQYPVRGEKETESEEDEAELSLSFTAYRPNDAGRGLPYLRMEQESEEEAGEESEKSFLYTLYDEKGEAIETTSVEYEQEEGETELKMVVRRGGKTDELWFRREDGRSNVLSARAEIGGREYSFTVTIEEEGYHYEFSDGNSGDGGRPGHGDDDDDDDDADD